MNGKFTSELIFGKNVPVTDEDKKLLELVKPKKDEKKVD